MACLINCKLKNTTYHLHSKSMNLTYTADGSERGFDAKSNRFKIIRLIKYIKHRYRAKKTPPRRAAVQHRKNLCFVRRRLSYAARPLYIGQPFFSFYSRIIRVTLPQQLYNTRTYTREYIII